MESASHHVVFARIERLEAELEAERASSVRAKEDIRVEREACEQLRMRIEEELATGPLRRELLGTTAMLFVVDAILAVIFVIRMLGEP